ncbi:hypothetical protein T02_16277 [Trichinella nativa]|uniref:Uncharacterized protein n=1 Tax=Trichinella nativa TaxID=6335 RepID=A0A0V1LLA7_9BILA|nr:hypothetical protein T06_6205 [Trichinella sp. T6]KRZ60280.1 hypothetical protein T02_16277 [Trichinella nativa]
MLQPPSSKSDSQFNCFDQKSSVPNKRLVIPRAEKTGRATQYIMNHKVSHRMQFLSLCQSVNLIKASIRKSYQSKDYNYMPHIELVVRKKFCHCNGCKKQCRSHQQRRQDDLAHLSGVLVKAMPTYN